MNEERTSPPLTEKEWAQALEFTRHYDNLLWVVTSLLTPANAALLAISVDHLSIEVGVLGILLSILTVFFAASFRLLRLRLHARLHQDSPDRYAWLYAGPAGWAGQWKIYVLFFAVVAGLWISVLWKQFPQYQYAWWVTAFLSAGVLGWLYAVARRHTPRDPAGS